MSAAIVLVIMPEGYRGQEFVAKTAPALTSSRVEKSIYNIVSADSLGVLLKIVGAAERFGFSYHIPDLQSLVGR
jgi:hypothetical protein